MAFELEEIEIEIFLEPNEGDVMFFELANEPAGRCGYDWQDYQLVLMRALLTGAEIGIHSIEIATTKEK